MREWEKILQTKKTKLYYCKAFLLSLARLCLFLSVTIITTQTHNTQKGVSKLKHTVKFCPNNFERELHELKSHVKRLSQVDILENQCLNFCGQCIEQPFSLVNGKNVTSSTAKDLYLSIMKHLETAPSSCSTHENKSFH
ncbi:DUF1450 domain-containing protein [Alteribacillus persepolensis]|uniref:DUF1450 domain-containing protein n=1 Tax=Alteribacillus persepolensis TaxID=568899 RepID=UPI000B8237E0